MEAFFIFTRHDLSVYRFTSVPYQEGSLYTILQNVE